MLPILAIPKQDCWPFPNLTLRQKVATSNELKNPLFYHGLRPGKPYYPTEI